MKQHLLHTPEGVRDIYNGECEKKLYLEDKLYGILKTYGCRPIQTPSFEFFDIFGKEVGTIQSRNLYKFFDREGNTLVLRPDITPSIARFVSNYYMEETMPLRFCYKGNTFINTDSLRKIPSLAQNLSGIILPMPMQKSCPWLPNACWEPD